MKELVFKHYRYVEIGITLIVSLNFLKVLYFNLFSFFYLLFYHDESGDDDSIYYIDGKPFKTNFFQRALLLLHFEETFFLLIAALLIFGIINVFLGKKIGLQIICFLMALSIIFSVLIIPFHLEYYRVFYLLYIPYSTLFLIVFLLLFPIAVILLKLKSKYLKHMITNNLK